MVIEKPQGFRARLRDFPGSRFSITVLECDFSIQPLGDEFREGKTRWNLGPRPSSLDFSPLLSEPRVEPRGVRLDLAAGAGGATHSGGRAARGTWDGNDLGRGHQNGCPGLIAL